MQDQPGWAHAVARPLCRGGRADRRGSGQDGKRVAHARAYALGCRPHAGHRARRTHGSRAAHVTGAVPLQQMVLTARAAAPACRPRRTTLVERPIMPGVPRRTGCWPSPGVDARCQASRRAGTVVAMAHRGVSHATRGVIVRAVVKHDASRGSSGPSWTSPQRTATRSAPEVGPGPVTPARAWGLHPYPVHVRRARSAMCHTPACRDVRGGLAPGGVSWWGAGGGEAARTRRHRHHTGYPTGADGGGGAPPVRARRGRRGDPRRRGAGALEPSVSRGPTAAGRAAPAFAGVSPGGDPLRGDATRRPRAEAPRA